MFKEITKDNWLLFAQQHYDNPTLEQEVEFYDDIKRFKYLIVLQNVCGAEVSITLLLFKIDKKYWSILKPILDYLSYLYPHELNDVQNDQQIVRELQKL